MALFTISPTLALIALAGVPLVAVSIGPPLHIR